MDSRFVQIVRIAVRQVPLSDIPDCDIIISGASCVPFSRNGKSLAWDDSRAAGFLALLNTVEDQAKRGRMEVFVLENVIGFCDVPSSEESSPLSEINDFLEEAFPKGWVVLNWIVHAGDLGCPTLRPRVFVVGRRVDAFFTPLPKFSPNQFVLPKLELRYILDPRIESDVPRLTPKMQETFDTHLEKSASWEKGQIVICDLSRSFTGCVRAPVANIESVPTLTAGNRHLFVFETGSNRFRRFLTIAERLQIHGFDPSLGEHLPQKAALRIIGNTMAVPAIGMVVACAWSGRT